MRRPRTGTLALAAVLALAASGCGDESGQGVAPNSGAVAAAETRLAQIQSSLDTWAEAASIDEAKAAAEAVSNAITGPGMAFYGDRDGDGAVGGATRAGLLPGEGGEPSLGTAIADCAGDDLLGGSWDEPGERWADLTERIDTWSPSDNRFPELDSHALRVVGWATLTLESASLTDALEYAGHAQLHVDASRNAVEACR